MYFDSKNWTASSIISKYLEIIELVSIDKWVFLKETIKYTYTVLSSWSLLHLVPVTSGKEIRFLSDFSSSFLKQK